MLEFIVLGQIPGTHFQITYMWFWFVVAVVLSYALTLVHKRNIGKIKESIRKNIEVITLSNLDQQA